MQGSILNFADIISDPSPLTNLANMDRNDRAERKTAEEELLSEEQIDKMKNTTTVPSSSSSWEAATCPGAWVKTSHGDARTLLFRRSLDVSDRAYPSLVLFL